MNRPPQTRRPGATGRQGDTGQQASRHSTPPARAQQRRAAEALFERVASKPFIVECLRDGGGRRLYNRFATWKEAFHCAAVLCAHGLPAEARDTREAAP
jgi:hypothetical protein